MANEGVTGTLVDDSGIPLEGLRVEAYDVETLFDDFLLGSDFTKKDGKFTITYQQNRYGLEGKPNLRVRVFDQVKRLLYETEIYHAVTESIKTLEQITLKRADVSGWLVTGGTKTYMDPGTGQPIRLTSKNFVEPIVDNAKAWEELTSAVQKAKDTFYLLHLYLDVNELITVFPSMPVPNKSVEGDRLEKVILDVNRKRGVVIKLLFNDFSLDPIAPAPGDFPMYPIDTASRVKEYFDLANLAEHHTVEVRRFPRPILTPMHAKFAVVDGRKAYLIGSVLNQEYFDAPTHSIDDPRRGTMYVWNSIKVPVHDVGLAIDGLAVKDLLETFFLHWDHVGTGLSSLPSVHSPSTSNANIQIVRTLPSHVFNTIPEGETGILEAYQRAIRDARDFIYLENQYFTEPAIADALILALKQNPSLELIMLINNAVDIPGYQQWQTNLINQLTGEAKQIGASHRIGIFTLWSHETTKTPSRIIRNYVHSKVAIVDDKWVTIGSANLDGVSLRKSQHISLIPSKMAGGSLAAAIQNVSRAVEVNAVIYNGVDGQAASDVPDKLRRLLWAEHLGFGNPTDDALVTKPNGGWLQLWLERAAEKLIALQSTPPARHDARILPWQPHVDPARYLRELGIKPGSLTVETRVHDYDFKTGTFKDKHENLPASLWHLATYLWMRE